MQGWSEVRNEFPPDKPESISELRTVLFFLPPTHFVALRGDWCVLHRILDRDENLRSATDLFGRTALHYVARRKKEEDETSCESLGKAIQLLLNSLDNRDYCGMTALHAAAETGNAEIIGLLVQHGAGKEKIFQNRTALHIAVEMGHVEVVRKLTDLGADTGYSDVVTELLGKVGADAVDELGRKALHLAAATGNKVIIELLLNDPPNKAAIDAKYTKGWTALHRAVKNRHTDVTSALLENGVAVDATANGGVTALHWAAAAGHKTGVSLLLAKGAALEVTDGRGTTALDYAVYFGNRAVVRVLLQHNAIFVTNTNGMQTLHRAVRLGYREIVCGVLYALLLKNRAAVDVTDTGRRAALHWGKRGEFLYKVKDIVQVVLKLLQEAVKPGTPPDLAAFKRRREAVYVVLYTLLGNGGANAADTETDTSGRIVQPQAAEPELTHQAEVLGIVNSIEELLKEKRV